MFNILVIGDVMIDHYRLGISNRLSPEAPVPIVLNPKNKFSAGGAANVALNLNYSDLINVTLLGLIGDDNYSKILIKELEKGGVKLDLKQTLGSTIKKERIICNGSQVSRIDIEYSCPAYDWVKYLKKFEIDQFDYVILSDYGKGCLTNIEGIIKLFKIHKIPVFVDPKGKEFIKYKNAFAITPNEKEFIESNEYKTSMSFEKNIISIRNFLKLSYLFVSLGDKGLVYSGPDDKIMTIPTEQVHVVDVTGAGDVLIASIVENMAKDKDVKTAILNSVKRATKSVSIFGTGRVYENQLDLNDNKQKIIFTNGCFDMLHAGHVNYLKEAKSFGHYLIVGLNSDESVRKIKGKAKPIIKVAERKYILEALTAVDEVIVFEEKTPLRLIKKIKPDVLVKGQDYKENDIVGANFVKSYGGLVKTIPFKFMQSSSKIIHNILTRDDDHEK